MMTSSSSLSLSNVLKKKIKSILILINTKIFSVFLLFYTSTLSFLFPLVFFSFFCVCVLCSCVWCVVCGVLCVVSGVWCVVCGVWCVVPDPLI